MSITYQHRVTITPTKVCVNGRTIATENSGTAMLAELYRRNVNDHPKFFKMDTLCRLGFIASELLLNEEAAERVRDCDNRAIILFNRSASLNNDSHYQATIGEEEYFPSPALFVYTLPNIVTGEIAIRNKYYGETAFYVLEEKNERLMEQIIESSFTEDNNMTIIGGWMECSSDNNFEADIRIYSKV